MRLILICLVFLAVGNGGYSAEVELIEVDESHMEIEVALSSLEATPQDLKKNNKNFSRVPIEGEGFHFGFEGSPELPVIHRWIVVPEKSRYEVKVYPGGAKVYQNILLYPAQPDSVEEEAPEFEFKKSAYLKNTWYGDHRVRIGKKIKLGPVSLLPVQIWPAEYHPLKRELRIYPSVKVQITLIDTPQIEEPLLVSPFVAQQISELSLNGKNLLKRGHIISPINSKTRKMALLFPKKWKEFSQELADLHQAEGTTMELIEVPQGLKPSAVKSLLKNRFVKALPDAVLIFGDEATIPLSSFNGKTGDFWYSLLSGSDQVSDVAIGRLPIKSSIQAKIIINKIKKYQELKRLGFVNKKVMLLAHSQDYPGKYTRNMEHVRKNENPLSLEFNTQYGGENGKNASVLEEAKKGYAIINYRGHGSLTSWSSWGSDGASFSSSQVKALPNEETSLSFIFNVACTNGAIQSSSPALVEMQLFPEEDISSLRGAVGTFGATAPSLTEVNHRFNLNLFESLQNVSDKSIGNLYTLANNKLTKDNGGTATSNTRMYVLFSDPLLAPWVQ